MFKSDSMPFQSPININVLRHIFIIKVSKRPSRNHCYGPPLQCSSDSIWMGRWKSQSRRVVGEMVQRLNRLANAVTLSFLHSLLLHSICVDALIHCGWHSITVPLITIAEFILVLFQAGGPESYSAVPSSFSH